MATHRDRESNDDRRRHDRSSSHAPDGGKRRSRTAGSFHHLPIVAYKLVASTTSGASGLIEVTRAIQDLTGYAPDEWINDGNWQRAILPEDRDRVLKAYADRLSQAGDAPFEYRLLARDGAVVWVRDQATATADDEGRAVLLGVLIDITQQKELETALQSNESRFFAAFDDAGIPLGISDLDGRLVRVNRPHCELFGYEEDELIGLDIRALIVSEEREQAEASREALIAGRVRSVQIERHYHRKDGAIVQAIVTLSMLRDASGQPMHILAQLQDIGGQRRAEAALHEADERYRTLVEHAPDIITRIDRDFRHLYMNPAAERVVGIPAERWIGHTAREVGLLGPLCDTVERLVTHVMTTGTEANDEFRYVGDGFTRDFEIQMTPEMIEDGRVATVLAVVREMTARVLVREQLEYQATHDALTGLLNRRGFLDRLARAIEASDADTASPAVLFIDLDDFKVVNDNLGHAAGDQVLIDVAGRFSSLIGGADAAARLGGDEFAMLIDAPDAEAVATAVARRILEALHYPFVVNRTPVEVSASIGIAVRSSATDQPADLLRWADIAMYQAKSGGKHRFAQFEPAHRSEDTARFEWEQSLRRAIVEEELSLEYQPVVHLSTGRVVAREALARWRHPRLGLIPPETFVPFADEVGLASALTALVLRRACADATAWPAAEPDAPHAVVVNLSARQFHDPTLADTLAQVLRDTGLDPSRIIFDVTEQALVHHADLAQDRIATLAADGIRVAIDQFGSGYTSLACLNQCPVFAVKLDRSFIGGLPDDPSSAAIVAAVVGLAHPLGIEVVAVGVETPEQARSLRDLGCDLAQGFAFGEPAPPGDLA